MLTDEARAAAARAARARALGLEEWQLQVIEGQGNISNAMKEDLQALSRVQQPRSMAQKPQEAPSASKSARGWQDHPVPVTQPEGIKYIDAMVETQNALDLVEKLKRIKP